MGVFLDRERELALLEDRLASGRAEFLVIYGRRRVGKTELIEQFLNRAGGVRLLAREEAKAHQLQRFAERLGGHVGDAVVEKGAFRDWDGFLEYLAQLGGEERFVVAVDEFPNLVKEDPSLPSTLQDYWDAKLRHTKLFLILCGSSITMMEQQVLGHRSPLYGRRTGQLLVRPLRFRDVLPLTGDLATAVPLHAVFGGTPAYLIEADPARDVLWNIRERILREDSFLYKDVEFLLRQELVEPRYYMSILHSIAKGNHKLGLIVNDTGLTKSVVNKYLSVLRDLHLVHREVPVTEDADSRKGLWSLADPFFRFWLRFVHPALEEVERGRADLVMEERVKPAFNDYLGRHFEQVVREAIEDAPHGALPFTPTKVGRWWDGGEEIDVVALNERTGELLLAECKWRERVRPRPVLAELQRKAGLVRWEASTTHLAVAAKSFEGTIGRDEGILLDLPGLARLLSPGPRARVGKGP